MRFPENYGLNGVKYGREPFLDDSLERPEKNLKSMMLL
jgi:hypothetical protein